MTSQQARGWPAEARDGVAALARGDGAAAAFRRDCRIPNSDMPLRQSPTVAITVHRRLVLSYRSIIVTYRWSRALVGEWPRGQNNPECRRTGPFHPVVAGNSLPAPLPAVETYMPWGSVRGF